MKKNEREIRRKGNSIVKRLGNGVSYAGPQMSGDQFEFHLFNDDAVTGGSFAALSLKEAKKELVKTRKRFEAPPPTFKKGP
ncbi:MAG: hypothetical protein WC919_08285 [Candidatus Paceibacterota bacterium]|jgi:hypothetical protein